MKIIFNLMNVGLGNNGGSRTIVESANTLQELGSQVVIVDNGPSKYTWTKLKVPYVRINNINKIDGDIIIATGINSVESTNESKIKNKYHWIRGWETWSIPEDKLVKIIKSSQTRKLVNSSCLKMKLLKHGMISDIIIPGYNFNEIYPLNIRENNKHVIIGGLYNQGKKRSKKRVSWIFDCYNTLKEEKIPIKLFMFGSDGRPSFHIDYFINDPNYFEKNKLYNMCDIWLSSSELEGLHIPPAEAMLSKCCVVGNNSEMSGTQDYLINNETGIVSDNNFKSFLESVKKLINEKELRYNLGKKGREKILSLGDRKRNMTKMIKLFEKYGDS